MYRFLAVITVLLTMLFGGLPVFSQSTILMSDDLVKKVINETSGEKALNNEFLLGAIERNRPESEYTGQYLETEFMLGKLAEYGFSDVHVENFMGRGQQWDAVKARLTIVSPSLERIADHDEVAASVSGNSMDTDITTELVYIPEGTKPESYEGKDVAGKIVISEGRIGSVFAQAVNKFGAAGVVNYETRYPDLYPDMLLWNSVPAGRGGKGGFGFNIRYPKGVELIKKLKAGEKIQLHAEVEAKYYPNKLEVVSALIPGTDRNDQELLLIAHLYEGVSKQGGNDNYSGVVCIMETGRTILELIRQNQIEPLRRPVRFLFVPEISGTRAYIKRFPEEIQKMIAAINMDMVGEDLFKTRSIFHVSRTAHSVPSFFNDVVQEFAELTEELNNDAFNETYGRLRLRITSPNGSRQPFHLNIMGYDSGSDHIVLSNGRVGVPTVYLNCWPDDFYHSSYDTPDKTDPTQLRRVAFIAAASVISTAGADSRDANLYVSLVEGKGRRRIADQVEKQYYKLGAADKKSISDVYLKGRAIIGKSFDHEIDNLNTISLVADNDRTVVANIENAADNIHELRTSAQKAYDDRYRHLCESHGIEPVSGNHSESDQELDSMIPAYKTDDMVEKMETALVSGLPYSHEVYRYGLASREISSLIDGKRSILDIAHMLMSQFGGPGPDAAAEYFKALESKGSIEIRKK